MFSFWPGVWGLAPAFFTRRGVFFDYPPPPPRVRANIYKEKPLILFAKF